MRPMKTLTPLLLLALLCGLPGFAATRPAFADSKVSKDSKDASPGDRTLVLHVIGLFERDREAALRDAVEQMPGARLVGIDFDHAEATFVCDPTAFKGTPPDKLPERLDQLLRNASGHLLSLKPRSTAPREKLTRVEVTVAPLDCKACALGVHEIVIQVPGVEQVVVDMKEGHIAALVDPAQADREKIRAALKRHEVTLKEP